MRRLPLRYLLLFSALGLSLVLGGCLYMALRTRTLDASAMPPFNAVVGRDLPLLREARIVRSLEAFVHERPYRMISDPAQSVFEGEPPAIVLPAGTVLHFDAVRLIRHGTSGFTHPTLMGTLTLDGQAYAFEYEWGEGRYMNADGTASFGSPLRFLFPQAPWQPAADPKIYTFPEP